MNVSHAALTATFSAASGLFPRLPSVVLFHRCCQPQFRSTGQGLIMVANSESLY